MERPGEAKVEHSGAVIKGLLCRDESREVVEWKVARRKKWSNYSRWMLRVHPINAKCNWTRIGTRRAECAMVTGEIQVGIR